MLPWASRANPGTIRRFTRSSRPLLTALFLCLKLALSCAIVAGMHATTTREIVDLYGRGNLTLVGLGAMLVSFFSNWLLSGSLLFEKDFWTSLAISDHLAVMAFAFGIGLLIQVVRFWKSRRGVANASPSKRSCQRSSPSIDVFPSFCGTERIRRTGQSPSTPAIPMLSEQHEFQPLLTRD